MIMYDISQGAEGSTCTPSITKFYLLFQVPMYVYNMVWHVNISRNGYNTFFVAVFGGHCFRYFVIYIGKWAILKLYTQIECLWVSKFDWNCPKCFEFLIIDTQSTNLFLFKAFREHFQFTEEKDAIFRKNWWFWPFFRSFPAEKWLNFLLHPQ